MANIYENRLRQLMDDPSSFQQDPGFQFALDTGLNAANRRLSASGMRGSGNALAELTRYGTGLAFQQRGEEMDRLGRLMGQERDYELGNRGLDLQAELGRGRLGLDRELGTGQLGVSRDRLGLDRDLGIGSLGLQARGQDINREQNRWNYDLGRGRLGLDTARAENDYNLGAGRNSIDWFNAGTARGAARSNDWWRGDDSAREWLRFNPPRRYV